MRVMGASATYAGQYAAAVSLLEEARDASGDPRQFPRARGDLRRVASEPKEVSPSGAAVN